jgi:hypothetical protein
MEENEAIFEIFCLCESQLRVGFGGAYALDWSVVMKAAEVRGVDIGPLFFILLKHFEQALIERLSEPSKNGGR